MHSKECNIVRLVFQGAECCIPQQPAIVRVFYCLEITMANYSFSTDRSSIVKGIASVRARGANLDRDIGLVAASAIAHGQIHGDVTLFGDLCAAMPRGSRVKTLIEFVQTCAPIAVKVSDKGFQVSIDKARVKAGEFESDRSDWDIETLKVESWTEFKKGKVESEYTLDHLLAMLDKLATGKKKGATEAAMDAAAEALKAATSYRDSLTGIVTAPEAVEA
jgi:hypothetical protein